MKRIDSRDIARKLLKAEAIEHIKIIAEYLVTERPTPEQRKAFYRARANVKLIRELGV